MVKSAIGYPSRRLLWVALLRRNIWRLKAGKLANLFRRLLPREGRRRVPVTLVTAGDLARARLLGLGPVARRWAEATDYAAEPGQLCSSRTPMAGWPGPGRLAKANRYGRWAGSRTPCRNGPTPWTRPWVARRRQIWRSAGRSAAYAFTRYRRRRRVGPIGVARRRRPRAGRGAGGGHFSRPRPNRRAGRGNGASEFAGAVEEMAAAMGAPCRVIVGHGLLEANYPTIHAVGRASSRAPRLVDLTWGDPGAPQGHAGWQGRVLRHRRPRSQALGRMLMMKKDMGGAATVVGLGA